MLYILSHMSYFLSQLFSQNFKPITIKSKDIRLKLYINESKEIRYCYQQQQKGFCLVFGKNNAYLSF